MAVIPLALKYAAGIFLSRAHPTLWGITPQGEGFDSLCKLLVCHPEQSEGS